MSEGNGSLVMQAHATASRAEARIDQHERDCRERENQRREDLRSLRQDLNDRLVGLETTVQSIPHKIDTAMERVHKRIDESIRVAQSAKAEAQESKDERNRLVIKGLWGLLMILIPAAGGMAWFVMTG